MTPTPAPGYVGRVVCETTIKRLNDDRAAGYRGPLVHPPEFFVRRDGPWALVSWGVGETGGQSIYEYVDNTWCMVMNGGGAMDERDMISVAGPVHGARLWAMWNKK